MEKPLKHIESINYEAQQFLEAFYKFRDNINAIDETLCTNLLNIVSEIDNFLGNKPNEIPSPKAEQITPANLDKFGVYKAFVCRQCGIEFGDNLQSVHDHLKSWKHQQPKKEIRRWNRIQIKPRKDKPAKNKEMETGNENLPRKVKSLILCDLPKFFGTHLPVAEKLMVLPDYKVIQDDLLAVLRAAFPNVTIKLYLFGSRISGIGSTHSDLDIFVDLDNVFNVFENRASPLTLKKVDKVEELLSMDPNWMRLVSIRNARVPILKTMHGSKGINCDIGFSNSLGYCNTKLIKYILELQPLARALCIFMKKWLEKAKLGEPLTTYALTLMVICFLQTKRMLPTIKELQDDLNDPLEIGPWMGTFSEKPLAELNISPAPRSYMSVFEKELREFFVYYSKFDFQHNVVCPYLGEAIPVENLETCPRLERYVKYVQSDPSGPEIKLKRTAMMVQDPFQMNNNTCKGVSKNSVRLLKRYFELSAELIVVPGVPVAINSDDGQK